MPTTDGAGLSQVLDRDTSGLLDDWIREQLSATDVRRDLISEAELRQQATEFLTRLRDAVAADPALDVGGRAWSGVRDTLTSLSRSRAVSGFAPTDTATFVFSLKRPLFDRLRAAAGDDSQVLAGAVWAVTALLDRLGLFTTEVFLKSREEVIRRQQQELMELSTPVVKLWEGVVAVPLIGTLDSARTQVVMENLLQRIVETGATVAIIDITGVPTVDTLVAQHLIKTISAARLMGADCIISGIRPQIAQTIVHLGVDLGAVITKASLADAIRVALQQTGYVVSRTAPVARS